LAAEILDSWAPIMEEVGLRSGTKGRFEIELDGQPVFSKLTQGRFPDPGEIVGLLSPQLGPALEWR
jgi:selT/selW/selH-like putative selenoprotein